MIGLACAQPGMPPGGPPDVAAPQIVRITPDSGATSVNNRIQISDAARQKAVANLEKGRRRVQIDRSEPRSDTSAVRHR